MKITALAGGVGASKLLVGLAHLMPPEDLTIIANTGDDIELFGLRICPDVDTITYTLAGIINEQNGWGLRDDSFECLRILDRFGGPAWFNLGDRDLATHIFRSDQLRQGRTLTDITDTIRRSLGVDTTILPMTDSYTPTRVVTEEGEFHFQEYFVRRRCEPVIRDIRFDNIQSAEPARGVLHALLDSDAIVLCPSNPFISIGPILAVPGIRDALRRTRAVVVAVTPIIGARALKGPAAEMLRDMGQEVSSFGVAELYVDIVDGFLLDESDRDQISRIRELGMEVFAANTVMQSFEDKQHVAHSVLDIFQILSDRHSHESPAHPS